MKILSGNLIRYFIAVSASEPSLFEGILWIAILHVLIFFESGKIYFC